jgi:hypothetical protein
MNKLTSSNTGRQRSQTLTLVSTLLLLAALNAPGLAQSKKSAGTPAEAPAPAALSTYEQELFRPGTTMLNLGLGAGSGLGYGSYYGTLSASPSLSLSAERGVAEGIGPGIIGVGGLLGYKAYHYDYPGTGYKSTWTNVLLAARGTYHYNVLAIPSLDTYGGVSLGLRFEHHNDTYFNSLPERRNYSANKAYLITGVFAGARYFLTDKLGAFAEVGYDINYLKLGLTARF